MPKRYWHNLPFVHEKCEEPPLVTHVQVSVDGVRYLGVCRMCNTTVGVAWEWAECFYYAFQMDEKKAKKGNGEPPDDLSGMKPEGGVC